MTIALKKNNMIDENQLDRNEAVKFILFLEEEKERHKIAIHSCQFSKTLFKDCPVLKQAYKSSIERHLDDIIMTQKTIDLLRNKWDIKIGEY